MQAKPSPRYIEASKAQRRNLMTTQDVADREQKHTSPILLLLLQM
jgi:hypothetical protein